MTSQPIPSAGPRPPEEGRAMTADEEAKFRESVRLLAVVEADLDLHALQWSNFAAIRLLATLDAARREARAQALAAVEEAVRTMPPVVQPGYPARYVHGHNDAVNAVLAVLAKLQEDEQ